MTGWKNDSGPTISINNGGWIIRVYPNGINYKSKGQTILFLQLCSLPPNISKIELRYNALFILMYMI